MAKEKTTTEITISQQGIELLSKLKASCNNLPFEEYCLPAYLQDEMRFSSFPRSKTDTTRNNVSFEKQTRTTKDSDVIPNIASSQKQIYKNIVSNSSSEIQSYNQLDSANKIVWAKLGTYRWWPAITLTNINCSCPVPKLGKIWVFWLGEYKISEVPNKRLLNFIQAFSQNFYGYKSEAFALGVEQALQILADQAELELSNFPDLLQWANDGFRSSSKLQGFCSLPEFVINHLNRIKDKRSNNTDSAYDLFSVTDSRLKHVKKKLMTKVKDGFLKIEDICISCAKSEKQIVIQHPLFKGGLCIECRDNFKQIIFALGEDGKNICCIICSKEGMLLLCDNLNCSRSYCCSCIEVLINKDAVEKILSISPWFCYFCNEKKTEDGLLKAKDDWEDNLMLLFHTSNKKLDDPPLSNFDEKKPLKVLSLFDGIGTGKYVLDILGIKVDKYYASEVDEDAINISKLHYGTSVIHIGDVTKITTDTIKNLCPIDLLIGGSPCNDISLVNPARKGLFDLTGTGHLYFDYFKILKEIKIFNKEKHVFWLFENVAAMAIKDKDTISNFFGFDPIMIDAKLFSAQSRPRFFWGNIPGMYGCDQYWKMAKLQTASNHEYMSDTLEKCLLHQLGRNAVVEKINTVTTKRSSLLQGKDAILPVNMRGEGDTLWVTELETVFGFPRHYTDAGNISLVKRRELLGRSWSVYVIRSLLKPLTFFFQMQLTSNEKHNDVKNQNFII